MLQLCMAEVVPPIHLPQHTTTYPHLGHFRGLVTKAEWSYIINSIINYYIIGILGVYVRICIVRGMKAVSCQSGPVGQSAGSTAC